MKKNKKFKKATPVIETKETDIVPGSVGEFIEVLKQFPAEEKFTLNGSVGIGNTDDVHTTISHSDHDLFEDEAVINAVADMLGIESTCKECDDVECDCDEYEESTFMKLHSYGISYNNPEFLNSMREAPTEYLTAHPIATPNNMQIDFESVTLNPNQYFILDEIRAHNAEMAEVLGELHRREIAALLEYNTQCLAHFGVATNKSMCEIVDPYKDKNK